MHVHFQGIKLQWYKRNGCCLLYLNHNKLSIFVSIALVMLDHWRSIKLQCPQKTVVVWLIAHISMWYPQIIHLCFIIPVASIALQSPEERMSGTWWKDRPSYIRLDYVSIWYHVGIYDKRLCSVWLDHRLGDIGIIIPPHGHLWTSKPHLFIPHGLQSSMFILLLIPCLI